MNLKNKSLLGFTLVELLIVIAILGTLAVVILVALNPAQQLARTRDAGRQSTVAQLGRAVEARATLNNGSYVVPAAGAWITDLQTAGEVSTIPSAPGTTITGNCTGGNVQNGICYNPYPGAGQRTRAIVYMRAEANSTLARCPAGTTQAYFVYSTSNGGAGIWCTAAAAEPGDPGVNGYTGANWIR